MAGDDLLGGDIQFRLGIDDKMSGGIRQADTAMLAFSGNVDRALSSIRRLAPAAAEITSIGLLAKNSVDAFAEWQEQLTSLNAVLGVSSDQIKKVGQAELDLGTKTIFTAKQINDATTTIAKAGNDAATSLKILPDALDLAAASLTTTKDAAIGLVTAQKAFNISNNDSADTANILSKAVNSSVGSFQTMTSELKAAGPIATVAGQSLKETANALASLENAGLEGAAGMAYKVFLEHVLNESPAAKKIVDELGLSFFDQAGQMKSVADIADQLYLKMGNLSDQQKGQDLNTIFGNYGGRVADIFANVGSSGLQDVATNQVNMADASDIAKERADSLSGALSRLRGAGDVVRIQIGEGLAPAVSTLAGTMQKASEATGHIIEATGPLTQMAVGLALVTAAYKGMNLVMDSATVKFGTMNQALEASIRPIDERAAALEHFNAIAPQKAGVDALVNQINAQNDAIARAGGTVTPPSQALLDRQKLLTDQESLLRKGATVSETEAYATRLEAYQESLARRKALLEEQDAWEEAERKRSTAALAEIDAKYVSKGKAVPQKIADAAAEQPFGKTIPITPVSPTFDEVNIAPAEAATLKSKIGSALSKAGLGFGELLIPVTVGVMAEQLIIEPLLGAIQDKIVDVRTKSQQYAVQSINVAPPSNDVSALQTQISNAEHQIDDFNKKKDELQKSLDGHFHPLSWFQTSEQQGEIDKLNELIKNLEDTQKKAKDTIANDPGAFKSAEAQRVSDLATQVQNGNMPIEDARRALDSYSYALDQNTTATMDEREAAIQNGLTQKESAANYVTLSQSLTDADTARIASLNAAQQAWSDYMDAQDAYWKDKGLGADSNTASIAALGVDITGAAASKQAVKDAAKDITELTKAWTDAQSAFSSLNITSLETFADSAPKLQKANEELTAVGQQSEAVSTLAAIAAQFKAVTDQEKEAESAFNAIMLLYNQTGTSLTFLDNFQKQVDQADVYARKRINLGIGTANDYQEVANYNNVSNNIAEMGGQLQEHQVSDVLGLSKVIPDLVNIDTKFRETAADIDMRKLIMTVTLDKEAAEGELQDFINKERTTTVHVTTDAVTGKNDTSGYGPAATDQSNLNQARGNAASGIASSDQSNINQATAGSSSGVTPGSAPIGYLNLGFGQYENIVNDASGGRGPMDDKNYYDALISAAQKYNVDPRAMLAFMKYESGDGATASPELIGANNLSGLKYDSSIPGESPGPYSLDKNADGSYQQYAQFRSPQDYFNTYAANLTTGDYQRDYRNGDLTAIRRRYVAGTGPVSDEQQQNISDTVSTYQDYLQKYPEASSGYGGGAGERDQAQIAASEHLTAAQSQAEAGDVRAAATTPPMPSSNSFDPQSILMAAQKHLGEMTQIDGEPWYLWCEKFVGNAVQEATGLNYRPASADQHVRNAEAGVAGAGTIVSAANARPGDEVGWEGSGSGVNAMGHIGIYEGGNTYIGTTSNGIQERQLSGDYVFIRPDGVVASGAEPGSTAYKAPSKAGTSPVGSNAPGTIDGTKPNPNGALERDPLAVERNTLAPYGGAEKMIELLNSAEHGLDSTGAAAVNRYQNQFSAYDTAVYKSDPNYKNQPDKAQALVDAQTLNATTAYAKLVNDIEHNTGNIAADEKEVRATSGPLADDAIREAEAVGKSAAALREKNSLQQANLNLDAQAKQNAIDRAAVDEKIADNLRTQQRAWQDYDLTLAASQLKSSRAEEDLKVKWQDQFDAWTRANQMATDTENIRWTTVSRQEQDQQRALQFQQQVQATDLQNKLADTQKAQQQQIWQRTSAEQIFAAQVKAAPTNQAAATSAAQLSMMHDQDLAQKDLNTQAIESIQLQIREQAKAANLASYNLQTAQIAEQRAHEDVMTRISQSSQAISFAQQDLQKRQAALDLAQTRYYEDAAVNLAAYRLKVTRGQEDDATNLAKARKTQDDQNAKDKQANNDRITQDDQIIADSGTITTDIENTFTQIDNWIVKIGADAAGAFGKFTPAPNQATPTVATLPGHAGGGTITEPLTVVGEEGPELLAGAQGMAVYTAAQTQAYLSSQGNGNTLVVQMPITVNAAGQVDEEAIIAAVMPKVENKIRSVLRSSNNQKKAVGR